MEYISTFYVFVNESNDNFKQLKQYILSLQDEYREKNGDKTINFLDLIRQPNGYFKGKMDIYVIVVDKIYGGQKVSQFMKKLTDNLHEKNYKNVYVYMMSKKGIQEDGKYFWGAHESAHCMAYKLGLSPDKIYYKDLKINHYPNTEEEHYTFKFQFEQMKKNNIDRKTILDRVLDDYRGRHTDEEIQKGYAPFFNRLLDEVFV